jgi:hypothetical protein
MVIGTSTETDREPPVSDLERLHDLAGDDRVIDPEDPDGLSPEERALHIEDVEGTFELDEHFAEGDLDEDEIDADELDARLADDTERDPEDVPDN